MRLPGTILQGILAGAALTFLRIYLGGVLVLSGWLRLQQGYSGDPGAWLVPYGGLLAGSALIVGLFTRLSAAGAVALSGAALLSDAGLVWPPLGVEVARACIALALIIGAAGRTFGVDSVLAKRWPRSPFW
jgi:uncharacterized membrane protein YphA (DoxX/SURF4 family)